MKPNENYFNSQELTNKLANGKVEIESLDIRSSNHLQAVRELLRLFPSKINSFKSEKEQAILKEVLSTKDSYKYFVNLTNDNHTPELSAIYLYGRLKADLNTLRTRNEGQKVKAEPIMNMKKSYDEKLILTFSYKTANGEEVNYVDNELQMPVPLISKADVLLKVTNALSLIKKLDISVSLIGYNSLCSEIRDILNKIYRRVLFETVSEKSVNYYNLTNKYNQIEDKLTVELNNYFKTYGLEVSSVSIRDISIPNNAQETLENDFFNARRARLENDDRIEYEKKSLELYEKKAAIHAKYPTFAETLTEAEKDNAFRRHANKYNPVDNSVEIKNQKQADIKHNLEDKEVEKGIDIVPLPEKKKNIILICSIVFGLLAFIFLFIRPIGFIISGIILAILAVIILLVAKKDKNEQGKLEQNVDKVMGGNQNE